MRWREAAERLVADPTFRAELNAAIRPHAGVFWECAPYRTGDEPFETVVLPSRAVAGLRLDPRPFARRLAGTEGPVTAFHNLGGDARLVVPTHGHPHLAAFVREAPASVVEALWVRVGEEALARMGRLTWVSTSGLGVSWLHVRLDDRPKYITHRPFREARV